MPEATSRAFKIAFIGTHGVGKTTLCYGLAARLKARDLSLDVVDEVARRCPLPINQRTTVEAQAWILHTQIADELVASSRGDAVLCDRSVLDNYVYLLIATGRQPGLEALIDSWLPSYDLLFRVPIIEDPKADGLRSTDPGFQRAVDERLDAELARRDLAAVALHAHPREDWLEVAEAEVWRQLGSVQLDLLSPPSSV